MSQDFPPTDSVERNRAEALASVRQELKEENEFRKRMYGYSPHLWVTYSLIIANVLVWVFTLTLGGEIWDVSAAQLFSWGGNATFAVQHGEWWRMFSSLFLHADLMHLVMNMLGLFILGRIVERTYGALLFLVVYLGSGLIASSFSLLSNETVSVGASGAVFGLMGALLVGVIQNSSLIPRTFSVKTIVGVSGFVIYSLVNAWDSTNVDNAAHIGGFVGGCLAASILPERFDIEHYQKAFWQRAVVAPLTIVLASIFLVLITPPARVDHKSIYAGYDILRKSAMSYDETIDSMADDNLDPFRGLSQKQYDQARAIYGPTMDRIAKDLKQVVLHPKADREPVDSLQQISAALAELLLMERTLSESSGLFEPINPQRALVLRKKLGRLAKQLPD